MSAWTMTPSGVGLVTRLELRQRVRSSRWIVILALWFVFIGGITALTYAAMGTDGSGAFGFSVVVFLVLTLGLLVAPAFSATSVDGDRAAGTLATLQMTLLSPADIAVGKLLAAWLTALVFLAAASPFVLLSLFSDGTSVPRVLVALLMMSVLLLAVCAIGLGWSAVCVRTVSSAVLTYVSVAMLSLFTLIFFGLSVPLVTTQDEVTVLQNPPGATFDEQIPLTDCVRTTAVRGRTHTEWTWWLLAANPYVVLADAAPAQPRDPDGSYDEDVLSVIQQGVREARDGADDVVNECWAATDFSYEDPDLDTTPIWPAGLVINLGLGVLGLVVTVRRLTTPIGVLPRGQRVA